MAITVTPEQRDALYEEIVIRLSGIDAVWLATRAADFAAAERLGREYSDNLRLVLDDLGFGDGTGEPVELRTPSDVLRRVLERLARRAQAQRQAEEKERAEREDSVARSAFVEETCQQLLGALDAG